MPVELDSPLAELVAGELAAPSSPAAGMLCDAIRERFGEHVAAVLFYGSCLRTETAEGVLDFYVVVDSYRAAYDKRWLAWGNAALPPNVFYLELEAPELETPVLRTKYAVISTDAFEYAVSPRCRNSYIWARFAQPARIVYARDAESRNRMISACSQAVVTLVRRLGAFLPAKGSTQRFSIPALWQEAFRRTYGAEARVESEDTIRSVFDATPERYERAGTYALTLLAEEGWLERATLRGNSFEVEIKPMRRRLARWRWALERPLAKALGILRLLKSATTFGDWLPYALWKLERHTGVRPELSERQRRHPLIFGWPVIIRLFADRNLH